MLDQCWCAQIRALSDVDDDDSEIRTTTSKYPNTLKLYIPLHSIIWRQVFFNLGKLCKFTLDKGKLNKNFISISTFLSKLTEMMVNILPHIAIRLMLSVRARPKGNPFAPNIAQASIIFLGDQDRRPINQRDMKIHYHHQLD